MVRDASADIPENREDGQSDVTTLRTKLAVIAALRGRSLSAINYNVNNL